MARRSDRGPRKGGTLRIIEQIFEHPPVNLADLELRLSRVDATLARSMLVDLLRKGRLQQKDGGLLAAAFSIVGVEEARGPLIDIAADSSQHSHARAHAMAVLADDNPARMDEVLTQLSPDEVAPLAELSLVELLSAIQADPRHAEAVVYLLESTPGELQEVMVQQMEHCRRQAGTPAAAAYGEALRSSSLVHLGRRMLDAVLEEGGEQSAALLERLRDEATDQSARRRLQSAVLRVRTRAIDPSSVFESPKGFAHVGSCDGQGAFVVLGCFENPDGSLTMADLCIRCSGDIRDGFVLPRTGPEEVKAFVEEMTNSSGSAFARTRFAEAAYLVAAGVRRTLDANLVIPEGARAAMGLFERAMDPRWQPPGVELDVASPLRRPPLKEVRRLLQRPEYDASWFFDMGDLEGCGVVPPVSGRASARWIREAIAMLNSHPLQERLVGMALHMAQWHSWREEQGEGRLCRELARLTREAFERSPLVRVMLERSLEPVGPEEEDLSEGTVGDPVVRQHLKTVFFQELKIPRGRDLACLDFTEAALMVLDGVFDGLPGERRPREDERYTAAFLLGKAFTTHVVSGERSSTEDLARKMIRRLARISRLDRVTREQVVRQVIPELAGFLDEVCGSCPVSCFDHPGARMDGVFFSLGHPASQGQREFF